MATDLLFPTKEIKTLLGVSDCEVMHMRVSGKLKYIKKGNSFLYQLPDNKLLLKHSIANKLFNWYQNKHLIFIDNSPKEIDSINSTLMLIENILLPIERKFGDINISYGFVSSELNRYIQKNNPSGTSPSLDQHASSELNSANNKICNRNGLACDFTVKGYEEKMHLIMHFIVNNLEFDKIYYYGKNRPLHVSVGNELARHLQVMNISKNGRRIPGKKAYGHDAKLLAEEIIK